MRYARPMGNRARLTWTPGRWTLLSVTLSAGAVFLGCGGQSQKAPAEGTPDMSNGGNPTASVDSSACVPYDDTCPPGEYCQYLDGGTQCVAEGGIARDELCNDGARCQRGSICLYGSELYGDSCQQPCSLDKAYKCSMGRHTCFVAVGDEGEPLSFGVCRYSE